MSESKRKIEEEKKILFDKMDALRDTPIGKFVIDLSHWFDFAGGMHAFSENFYHMREWLHEPRFSSSQIKQVFPTVTYRQINHWERQQLITPCRDTEDSGWRRFSFVDVVCLAIITQQRTYGVSLDTIREDLYRLNSGNQLDHENLSWTKLQTMFGVESEPFAKRLTSVEMYVLVSTFSHVGAVSVPGTGLELAPLDVLVVHSANLMLSSESFLYIPISDYIHKAAAVRGLGTSVLDAGLAGLLTSGYRKLLWLLKQNDTESITIKKHADGKLNVSRLIRKNGRFNEQDLMKAVQGGDHIKVEAVKKDGQIVTIVIEERSQIEH